MIANALSRQQTDKANNTNGLRVTYVDSPEQQNAKNGGLNVTVTGPAPKEVSNNAIKLNLVADGVLQANKLKPLNPIFNNSDEVKNNPNRPSFGTTEVKTHESIFNASDYTTIIEAGKDAAGKAYGASKLLPAGALQTRRAAAIMSAKNLEAAQELIKSPVAKSTMAMANYADAYGGLAKKVPYIGDAVNFVEEYGRVQKASNFEERQNVVKAATVNYGGDKASTTAGTLAGAIAGAEFGTMIFPGVGTIVGGVVGTIGGAYLGHDTYDTNIAPNVRVKIAGEKFKE